MLAAVPNKRAATRKSPPTASSRPRCSPTIARSLDEFGPWFYRRLFWETGVIGQVLYLEAEASGIRGTGIGCFFDDATHKVFGLTGDRYQVLYHFTMGGPVEDRRLQTHPPYEHLERTHD